MLNMGIRSTLRAIDADRQYNLRPSRSAPSILILRQIDRHPDYNHHYLSWLKTRHERISRHVRLGRFAIPARLADIRLVVSYAQDPLREEYPRDFRRAQRIEHRCRKAGIPVVNPSDKLWNAIKSVALPRIAARGVRTAQVVRLDTPEARRSLAATMPTPFLIREDRLHTRHPQLIRNAEDLRHIDLNRYQHPIALEYIDVRSEDGLFRKYRYFVMGSYGAPRHVIISADWCVHAEDRINSPAFIEEELAYTSRPDPNHDLFVDLARALELDFVCFDYSYDRDGRIVVWEPNPLPVLWGRFNTMETHAYQMSALERLYSRMTRYYFDRAGLLHLAEDLEERESEDPLLTGLQSSPNASPAL